MKTLIVIDMQKDFIDGSLGTKEAQAIVPNVAAKIKEYEKNGDEDHFHPGHPWGRLSGYPGRPEAACEALHQGHRRWQSPTA